MKQPVFEASTSVVPCFKGVLVKTTIQSEITGTVWKIVTSVGASVARDQELVILESMKMEIPAVALEAGTVREILVNEGDSVKEGQDLIVVERV